jgi:hypothetical protein
MHVKEVLMRWMRRWSVMIPFAALAACDDLPTVPTSSVQEVGTPGMYSISSDVIAVWGPVTLTRAPGKPEPLLSTINVANPVFYRDAVLVVRNGRPDGSRTVSAAVVRLNGVVVAGPSTFSGHGAEVRIPIDLTSGTMVEAELRGAPNGELTIWVEAVPLTQDEIAIAILERFIFDHLPHPQFAGGSVVDGTKMAFWIERVHRVKVTGWGVDSNGSGGAGFLADIDALVEYPVWDDEDNLLQDPHYQRMPLRISGAWAIYGPIADIDPSTLPFLEYLQRVLAVNSAAHRLGVDLTLVDGVPVQVNVPDWPE